MSGAELGYLLAFLAMFVSSMSNFPFTVAARKWGPVAVNHYRLLVAFIALTVLCITIDKESITELFAGPSLTQYTYVSLSGVLGLVIGDYFGFNAMAILGARVSSIFNAIAPVATLIFGYILLSETINGVGLAGIIICMSGVIWFLLGSKGDKKEQHHGSIKMGIIFGLLACFCQGFNIVISKKGFLDTSYALSPLHVTWIRIFAATVVYFLFTFSRGRLRSDVIVIVKNGKEIIPSITLATLWGLVLSIVLLMWSITLCKVAVAQTIIALVPIVVVPMSFVLYKERLTFKTMIAAIVSVAGVFILIWREDIMQWLLEHLH